MNQPQQETSHTIANAFNLSLVVGVQRGYVQRAYAETYLKYRETDRNFHSPKLNEGLIRLENNMPFYLKRFWDRAIENSCIKGRRTVTIEEGMSI